MFTYNNILISRLKHTYAMIKALNPPPSRVIVPHMGHLYTLNCRKLNMLDNLIRFSTYMQAMVVLLSMIKYSNMHFSENIYPMILFTLENMPKFNYFGCLVFTNDREPSSVKGVF